MMPGPLRNELNFLKEYKIFLEMARAKIKKQRVADLAARAIRGNGTTTSCLFDRTGYVRPPFAPARKNCLPGHDGRSRERECKPG